MNQESFQHSNLSLPLQKMETSQQQQQQPLSIESFSYSWLANLKPSLEALLDDAAADESAASSYIEMDPRMPPSKRFFRNYSHDFDFNFPANQIALVHADELFADGYVVPFFLRKPNHRNHADDDDDEDCEEEASNSVTSSTGSTGGDGPVRSGAKTTRRCSSLRRVLEKYLELIGPLLGRLSGRRGSGPRNQRSLSSRSEGMVMDNNKKKKRGMSSDKLAMKRWLSSGEACTEERWRRSSSSCDSESSIRDAVLHCKRSFGN